MLHRVTEPRRLAFRPSLVDLQEAVRTAAEEQERIDAQPKGEQDRKRYLELESQIIEHSEELNLRYVNWGLYAVQGLSVDDVEVTPANFVELAPKALFDEVLLQIRERTALGGAEIKNSQSPSTLSDPVDLTKAPTALTTA